MGPSLFFFLGHCLCCAILGCLAWFCKIAKRWVFLFSFLFFISPPAVFLIWGPYRFYGLYALTFIIFLFLAMTTARFYVFLKSQEAAVRFLFWAGWGVFGAAVIFTSTSEIHLRRDALTFWSYESKRHPTPEAMSHLYDVLGRVAQEKGDWDLSVGYYQKLIVLKPKWPQGYLGLGEGYRAMGKTKEAVEIYSRLLELYPDDEGMYVKVIEAYGRAVEAYPNDRLYQEKREEVLADFEELSKRKKYSAVDYFNLGFLYEQVGGKDEAVRFYTKAVQMQPDYKQALYNLAKLYQDTGNYKIASGLYERLLHFHPKFVPGYLNMGMIFNALGDQTHARQFYLKVIALDPQNGNAYFDLGYLSESQGELQEAINYYEKAIDASPKNAEAYYNLGNVYADLKQNGEAIALYLKTVGLNPRHQDAFVNLSILSFKSRDFAGAIHYLEQAQSLGYNPPAEYLKTLEPYRK